MRIFVIGARGFPEVQGGIEKHCEEIYPLLSNKYDITVLTTVKPKYKIWKNINFIKIPTIQKKSLEKIVYAFFGSIYCVFKRPDIVHVQGLNSALFIPMLRFFKIKVVYTQHSMDYLYPKWGNFAKKVLLISEFCSTKANKITVVSSLIQQRFKEKYLINSIITYNGVSFNKTSETNDSFSFEKNLLENKYLLFVGRITPEKDLITLIKAFNKLDDNELFLYVVGDADHSDKYVEGIKHLIKLNNKIVLLGQIKNNELPLLYSSAKLFVLPSMHEAFPIVPLEAIYFKTQLLLSDIDALKQFDFLPEECFFKVKDIESLKRMILKNLNYSLSNDLLDKFKTIVESRYRWDITARQFDEIYLNI